MGKPIEIAVVLSAYDKMSATIKRVVDANKKRIESINKVSNGSIVAGAALTGGFMMAVNAAEESEVATKRLNQVFKQMGDTTGKAGAQSADYASKLQMQIGFEDEVIMATQAKIATFKHLSNETGRMSGMFDRATAAAFDMQATGFGEASSNAVQLGKALENPVKGVNALSRAGITFSDTEKKKIKALVESGRMLKAQEMIMKAVEKQVGGVAAATATESAKAKIAFGEVSETIGKTLLPTVNRLAQIFLTKVIPVIQKFVNEHPRATKYVAALAIGLIAFGVALRVVSFTLGTYNVLIGLFAKGTLLGRLTSFLMSGALRRYAITFVGTVIPAIGSAITATVSYAVTMATTLWASLVSATAAVWSFTAALLANPITWIIVAIVALAMSVYMIVKHWDKVKAFFSKLWINIKEIFWKVVDWLIKMFLNFTPYGLIFKHWGKISAFFLNLWAGVKAIFFKAVSWFIGLHVAFFNAGKNIVNSIWNGIKAMASKPVEAIKAIVKKVRDFLPFSPAKEGPLRDIHRIKLIETIAGSIKAGPMVNAMQGVMKQVSDFTGGSSSSSRPALSASGSNGGMNITFSPVINLSGTATRDDANNITSTLKAQFKTMMREYESNNKRVKY